MKTDRTTAAALEECDFDARDAGAAPCLSLVPDNLETLLAGVIADLRSSDPSAREPAFERACHRDAIAAIEAGDAAGLLRPRAGRFTVCEG